MIWCNTATQYYVTAKQVAQALLALSIMMWCNVLCYAKQVAQALLALLFIVLGHCVTAQRPRALVTSV